MRKILKVSLISFSLLLFMLGANYKYSNLHNQKVVSGKISTNTVADPGGGG